MKFLSLFAGIGGFDLGLERAGMECVGQVEINTFCQKVLAKHWPNVKRIGDIHDVTGAEFGPVDLVCGGFPCQPFSSAGKRRGKADDRFLWPEMVRVIAAIRPAWVLGENVAGIISMAIDQVFSELESIGYSVQGFIIPACAVDAPHRRDRIWIIANSRQQRERQPKPRFGNKQFYSFQEEQRAEEGNRFANLCEVMADAKGVGLQRERASREQKPRVYEEERLSVRNDSNRTIWPTEPDVGRVAYGIPRRVDRLKSLGNAVVPQIVEILGKLILETERVRADRQNAT